VSLRITRHARQRMRVRHVSEAVVREVCEDPDDSYSSPQRHGPDRGVRWRRYDGQVVKVVVDLADDSIVSVWTTQVKP
jgi:hypothetical protein